MFQEWSLDGRGWKKDAGAVKGSLEQLRKLEYGLSIVKDKIIINFQRWVIVGDYVGGCPDF